MDRSYKLVNDASNINPFPASFLNNRCTIKLRPITVSNQTFVDIQSRFMTDHAMADSMEQTWERMYISMLVDLNRHMASSAVPQVQVRLTLQEFFFRAARCWITYPQLFFHSHGSGFYLQSITQAPPSSPLSLSRLLIYFTRPPSPVARFAHGPSAGSRMSSPQHPLRPPATLVM